MNFSKTNDLKDLDQLIKNYEQGHGTFIDFTPCPICRRTEDEDCVIECSLCLYCIPKLCDQLDFMNGENCGNWRVNGTSIPIPSY